MDAIVAKLTGMRRMLSLVLAAALPVANAHAITVTYVNAGPADSRVFVGFDNNASGNLTSDLVADPAAYSRNDTLYGPLPPPGDLPNFDAMVYSGAELGTNLNAPLGAGVRSVFAPFNPTFFRAHGETLAATGSYAAHAFAHSGNTTSVVPTHWIVHVDPSGAEVAGTPADVTVTGSIAGYVSVAGTSVADASWNVATAGFGTVMTGTANQSIPGSTPFADAGSLTFTIPLGTTFDLLVDYDLSTSGAGAGADSTSEITASLVEVSAVLSPPPIAPAFTTAFGSPLTNATIVSTAAGPYRPGRLIPVRFQLFDRVTKLLVSDAVAKTLDVQIHVYVDPPGAGTPVDLVLTPPNVGNACRYLSGTNQFFYMLKTRGTSWTGGARYRIVIDVDGVETAEAFFTLR